MKARSNSTSVKSSPNPRRNVPVYPFTAIVGQEEMKLALVLNAIDPLIGGVLIMGHRGTGKSTAVRALADLLPQLTRVRGCVYGCDPAGESSLCDDCRSRVINEGRLIRERASVPVIDLPLGATEDRVCGTIDIERALKEGVKAFEPGLLARANRGFLYIDEVNLLEDHLIDVLLDVAVTGRNVVEREGVSIEHPARFVLIGSGNPEEGELRPQLIDRFGLNAEVRTEKDLDRRVLIVEQREAFERSPANFIAGFVEAQEKLRRNVIRARKHLDHVKLSSKLLRRIAELCQQLKIDGHRGELTIARAARALAALEGRKEVATSDVRRVASMALRHRLRRDPMDLSSGGGLIEQRVDDLFPSNAREEKGPESDSGENGFRPQDTQTLPELRDQEANAGENGDGKASNRAYERTLLPLDAKVSDDPFDFTTPTGGKRITSSRNAPSRGSRRTSESIRRGRYSRAELAKTPGARIAIDATLRAWVGMDRGLTDTDGEKVGLPTASGGLPSALRYKRFKRKEGTLFIFAVDTSGSMALNRIAEAKGALAHLLRQSYIRRDRVAIVSFRGDGSELLMQPSGSVTRARRLLDELSVGGTTPLASGLACALAVAMNAANYGNERIVILLFTDGRANVSIANNGEAVPSLRQQTIQDELRCIGAAVQRAGVATVVVDTQSRFTSNGRGRKLAEVLSARYLQLESRNNSSEFSAIAKIR